MSLDSADLAQYFDTDLGAATATFTPTSGPTVSCTILVQRPNETSGVGLAGISTYNTHILVRLSEIADPSGGSFSGATALGGLTYIVADADLDETGAIWTCACRPST